MKEYNEPKTIRLTAETRKKLKHLKDDGYFHEMQDAFKFAVGLALSCHAIEESISNTGTIYGTGDIDQNNDLYETVKALRSDDIDEPVYKTVERLAEWGIKELYAESQSGEIDFSTPLSKVEELMKK